MAEEKLMRMSQVARKLNVGTSTIADHLAKKGFEIDNKPNAKITQEQYQILLKEFESSVVDKQEASDLKIGNKKENVAINTEESEKEKTEDSQEEEVQIKNVGAQKEEEEPKSEPTEESSEATETPEEGQEQQEEEEHKLRGIKVVGKIDLGEEKKEKEKETKKETKTSGKKQDKEEKAPSQTKKEEEKAPEPVEEPVASEKEQTTTAEKQKEEEKEQQSEETTEQQPQTEAKEQTQPEASEEKASEQKEETEQKSGEESQEQSSDKISVQGDAETLKGLKVVGKIDLPQKDKSEPVASSDESGKKESEQSKKKKRKRFKVKSAKKEEKSQEASKESSKKQKSTNKDKGGKKKKKQDKEEVSEQEIQDQIRSTLSRLEGGGKSRSKIRKEKRSAMAEKEEEKRQQEAEEANKLKVTEFISANELAGLMNVSVNDIISTSMNLGMFVSINQRLDAESITIIADEYGYDVEFVSEEEEYDLPVEEEEDDPSKLQERAPIVTVMGHVDHGKTTLLDYIKKTDIATGEAGGITQHVGAYDVETENGKMVTFLDTPGHEAFTAMRARGAKLTDVAIIVVAADDNVMPQTKEAINHAHVAGVPIIIAINKVDKPGANPDKIREELAEMNVLVEDWGGKYQCEEISAKGGQNISDLLEKVILEAEVLELKANPDKPALGTVIEASLDKGRGYVTNILVQEGKLKISDVILAGPYEGRVRAMMDYKGNELKEAGPSKPVQILGLSGAPQAGDKFNVMESEREAREIANKRQQILREQSLRAQKHITLDEIGRRLAIGNFKELNIIVKGDVDGSIEAIADSLLKLSTEEVQVNIIHKGVGQISESDVLLASASDAIIIGFQVRPSGGARKVAEREGIEIRLHSVIYDAINEVKEAMEGMLSPKIEEVVTGHAEVRDVFKVPKVGSVAGCYVTDGIIKRNNNVRVVRDGIVIYTGELESLKRYKDDVNEIKSGYECGISIKKFNDIKVGDEIEGFEEQETKRKLE